MSTINPRGSNFKTICRAEILHKNAVQGAKNWSFIRFKFTEFNFGWGCVSKTAAGAYSASRNSTVKKEGKDREG